jgi:hypothetical protein
MTRVECSVAKARFQASLSEGVPRTKPPPWMVKMVGRGVGLDWGWGLGKKMLGGFCLSDFYLVHDELDGEGG